MYNSTQLLVKDFANQLREGYHRAYGGLKPDYVDILIQTAHMALENIATSDALYHNVEHTILVTLTGQEILHGKHMREGGVSPEDWLHFTISLLCHDIGYVKGVCRADNQGASLYATGINGEMVELPAGCTDASLTPYHVDRGKLLIDERFGGDKLIDIETIKRNIELTRFPVPPSLAHQDTLNYPGLARAADLIGQLADPRYLQKISALFYEFEETGMNKALKCHNPGDLRRNYPNFFWNVAYPYIEDALDYLEVTQEGQQIMANLFANLFRVEHDLHQSRKGLNLQNQRSRPLSEAIHHKEPSSSPWRLIRN
ncbi:Npun_R2479 family HD domain-containing metalloprotein [Microseira wollei]|uniref:Metal-dependent phosphohydrolase n=1 Tax=Microseira wollei NIES-4236 TaxID=2530354 RepID=A0AAV3XKS3_9CYAN|nr:Npun_R2479 family HD domain-containing metalloprotein [Microseira wollei]GET41381.1 hypothetical protein MiSe_61930 [Microseira wollei NIES-4236]